MQAIAKSRWLVIRAAFLIFAAFGLPAQARTTVYTLSGKVMTFSDALNRLGLTDDVGSPFSGTIAFDPEDMGRLFLPGPDRVGSLVIVDRLTVDTPNDGAFVADYGNGQLFSGILPYNPLVFTTADRGATCAGSGGVTLIGRSRATLDFGCVDSPGLTVAGEGTFSISSAVSEPGAWLMMIVGFGLVGISLRGQSAGAGRLQLV